MCCVFRDFFFVNVLTNKKRKARGFWCKRKKKCDNHLSTFTRIIYGMSKAAFGNRNKILSFCYTYAPHINDNSCKNIKIVRPNARARSPFESSFCQQWLVNNFDRIADYDVWNQKRLKLVYSFLSLALICSN